MSSAFITLLSAEKMNRNNYTSRKNTINIVLIVEDLKFAITVLIIEDLRELCLRKVLFKVELFKLMERKHPYLRCFIFGFHSSHFCKNFWLM